MNPIIVVLDPNNLLIDNNLKKKLILFIKIILFEIGFIKRKYIYKYYLIYDLKHLKLGDQTQAQKFFINKSNSSIKVNIVNIINN